MRRFVGASPWISPTPKGGGDNPLEKKKKDYKKLMMRKMHLRGEGRRGQKKKQSLNYKLTL